MVESNGLAFSVATVLSVSTRRRLAPVGEVRDLVAFLLGKSTDSITTLGCDISPELEAARERLLTLYPELPVRVRPVGVEKRAWLRQQLSELGLYIMVYPGTSQEEMG